MKNQKPDNATLDILENIARRAHYYAMQMIDIANHKREHDRSDPKVGGHPAASASALHILGALHLWVKSPFDHIAVKPHASPTDHSYNYLLRGFYKHGGLERLSDDEMVQAMHGLRKFSKDGEPVFQSYHSEWDPDRFNFFPSGSVGIPPVMAAYLGHAFRFAEEHGYEIPENAHFWSLIGDSEFREGSLYEAIPDAAEREIGHLTWIVDYNRQSLDGQRITNRKIMNGTDDRRIERTAKANGWEVIQVQHGRKRIAAFGRKGGDLFKDVLENGFDDYEFQSLLQIKEGKAIADTLVKKEPKLKDFLKSLKETEILDLLLDLGGHDFSELISAMQKSTQDRKQPSLIIAHTVKGWGLQCRAVSGNHSMLPDNEEIESLRNQQKISAENIFERFSEKSAEGNFLKERGSFLYEGLKKQFSLQKKNASHFKEEMNALGAIPHSLNINLKIIPLAHTQWMLGQLTAKLTRIANTPLDEKKLRDKQKPLTQEERCWKTAAELLVTMAPDVGTSTNLNPSMDGKVFGPETVEDFESEYHVKDTSTPDIVPGEEISHRHLRFEIAEGNAMSCVGSYGKMRDITGIPFIPLMTVYDFFIKRALDQFFYNLYWRSSFICVGTPSGVSLSPEGAQHGWKSDFQIPNTVTWEPFFCIELDWIFSESVRLHLENVNEGRSGVLIRATTRSMDQRELLKRLKNQQRFRDTDEGEIFEAVRQDVLAGGYYLVDYRGADGYEPGDNVITIFAMGTMGTEALKASDKLLEKGIYANVIMVSSPDLLIGSLGHSNGYSHLKQKLGINGDLHLIPHLNGNAVPADIVTLAGRRVPCVSVHDGEPGLLDNIGSIVGVKQETLAVRHHSKSGTPGAIYRYHHIDSEAVIQACGKVLSETALEEIHIAPQVLEKIPPRKPDQDWQELWPH